MPDDSREPIILPEHLQILESRIEQLLQAVLPLHQLLDTLKRPGDQETSLIEKLLAALAEGNEMMSVLLTETRAIAAALSNSRLDLLIGQNKTREEVQSLGERLSHLSDPNAGLAKTIYHMRAAVAQIQRMVQEVQTMPNGPID